MDIPLGHIQTEDIRDAFHIAVITMKASEMLRPAQRVGILSPGIAGPSENCIGIVDPFLIDVVPKESKFLLCLLPNTVTGMTHHWKHPIFDSSQESDSVSQSMISNDTKNEKQREAEEWIREQCEPLESTFEELTDLNGELLTGQYLSNNSTSISDYWYDIEEEFWEKIEIYHGITIPVDLRGGFTCCY